MIIKFEGKLKYPISRVNFLPKRPITTTLSTTTVVMPDVRSEVIQIVSITVGIVAFIILVIIIIAVAIIHKKKKKRSTNEELVAAMPKDKSETITCEEEPVRNRLLDKNKIRLAAESETITCEEDVRNKLLDKSKIPLTAESTYTDGLYKSRHNNYQMLLLQSKEESTYEVSLTSEEINFKCEVASLSHEMQEYEFEPPLERNHSYYEVTEIII